MINVAKRKMMHKGFNNSYPMLCSFSPKEADLFTGAGAIIKMWLQLLAPTAAPGQTQESHTFIFISQESII
jgi:hypothetical protein